MTVMTASVQPAAVRRARAKPRPGIDFAQAARQLAALGHELRIQLYYLLVRCGPQGMTVGEIQQAMDRPTSTVMFHLRELVAAGLVSQAREGRSVRCRPRFEVLETLLDTVRRDCCTGEAAGCCETAKEA